MNQRRIIFLNSHPIQYFAPMYREIEKSGYFDLEVWYCTKHGLAGDFDRQFNTSVKWDIPLLDGYKFKFLKNNSFKKGIYNGFFGLFNWEIINNLKNEPPSLVIVPGWNYASYWIAILVAKRYGHQLALRGESPLNQEIQKKWAKKLVRRILLGGFLFKMINYALYIGTQNHDFYKYYGVPEAKLVFVPYAVDNQRFQEAYMDWAEKKDILRESLGLDKRKVQILFSGKYIFKKRPLDLLQAFSAIGDTNVQLVMVGDGELRKEMEVFIAKNNLGSSVVLTGFVNQGEIVKYYAAADIFVMCSGVGETWGLSVNEAMNFGLPIIISDKTGNAIDLVDGNGFVFQTSDIVSLSEKLLKLLQMNDIEFDKLKLKSLQIINKYSFQMILKGLLKI